MSKTSRLINHSRILRPYAILFLLLISIFLLFSCAPKQVRPFFEETAGIDWQNETPASVLRRLQESGNRIKHITSFFALSLDPPPKGQFSNLNGVLYLDQKGGTPKVRIKALGVFGRTLFDMMHTGKNMKIYVPAQKTLYQGNVENDLPGESPFGEVFQSFLVDLSSLEIKDSAQLILQKNDVVLPLKGGEIVLDKMTGLIMNYRNSRQEIAYNGYQRIDGYPPIPVIIEINNLEDNQKARCELRDINFDDNSENFTLTQYKPRFVKSLNELDTSRSN